MWGNTQSKIPKADLPRDKNGNVLPSRFAQRCAVAKKRQKAPENDNKEGAT